MEVRASYKQTQVGSIPQRWEVHKLPEVSWFQEGPGLRNWQFSTSGMKVINVTNLENGFLNLDRTDRHISIDEFNRMYKHFAIEADDIVMASSGNSYSKTAIVRAQDLPLVMNTSVIRFRPEEGFDYGFLWVFLNSPLFKSQIDLMITGGAQPNFGPYHLKRIYIPVPPLPEQRAIATALSDMDALLDGLDHLIAKKRAIKQATMQQLLTGQTRLPGFSGEWEVKRLGDVLTQIGDGSTPSTTKPGYFGGSTAWVVIDDIKDEIWSTRSTLTEAGLQACAATLWPVGTLILSTGATIGEVGIAMTPLATKQGICGLVFDSAQASSVFMKYWFAFNKSMLLAKAQGSSIKEVRAPTLVKFEIALPTVNEQAGIAVVLSDMDAEITALETRRTKTCALKQAMMQELLTGRTWLV